MSQVITTERLESRDLKQFAAGDALAVVVKDYYSHIDQSHVDKIDNHESLEEYSYVTNKNGKTHVIPFGVKRLGVPFSSSFGKSTDSEPRRNYYRNALSGMRELRRIFEPQLSPIDKLRLDIDELWPDGAGVGRVEGELMFTGIVRITEPQTDILEKKPHVDSMTPDIPFQRQYAANIYLDVPEEGGELVIYPERGFLTQEEVHDMTINENLWSHNLGEPVKIKPDAGDLILIHTQIPHAVQSFKKGRRISVQTFFACDDTNKINFWC